VGFYIDDRGRTHGFVWDDGDFRTIDVPGATATGAIGINNRGQIVGYYSDAGASPTASCATVGARSPPCPMRPAVTRRFRTPSTIAAR
jgi:uncharacterized membrane protein